MGTDLTSFAEADSRETRMSGPALQGPEAAEITRLRLQIFAMSAENERLRNTVSYQLGSAILAAKHWRGLMALPTALLAVIAESRRRHGHRGEGGGAPAAIQALLRQILVEQHEESAEDIIAVVEGEKASVHYRATVLTELARIMRPSEPAKALSLIRHAVKMDPSPARSGLLAGMLVEAGAIEEPRRLYARLAAKKVALSLGARQKSVLLEGMARVRDKGLVLPKAPTSRPIRPANPQSIVYVAASSSPYHTTGYTSRTQALVKAIGKQGWKVDVATRPGYPQDRNDVHRLPPGAVQTVDGVDYTLLTGPRSNGVAFDKYCADASQAILRHIEKNRPALVHAASNYLNATPALIAARRAGLPFVYEVRGLWELTHAAKDPRFEGSERFEWQKAREIEVATQADMVVAISQGLKAELVRRGVDQSRITVVPNCVDPSAFQPRGRDKALAKDMLLGDSTVLGFVGSMMSYEGLIDLVSALAALRRNGHDVCALLVGDGPAWQEVREAARSMAMQHHIIMPGRVPHAEVGRWYSLMDMAVYPRRPSRVTELVPPLKPLEAMAMGLPVVASDVSAICESITHEHNGFLFERGNVASLVATLERVLSEKALVRKVAKQGHHDVRHSFTWEGAARDLTEAYRARLAI